MVWPANVAVTILGPSSLTVQVVCVPLQAPDQDWNAPPCAVAVNVMAVPASYVSKHAAPHRMPDGLEDTNPLPCVMTVSEYPAWTIGMKSNAKRR